MFRLKILTCLLAFTSLGTAHELDSLQFSDNDFKLVNPNVVGRKSKQFSFFSEPEDDN